MGDTEYRSSGFGFTRGSGNRRIQHSDDEYDVDSVDRTPSPNVVSEFNWNNNG